MMLLDQLSTEQKFTDGFVSATAIPGIIKNAEGKIGKQITYARITIRRKMNENRT